MTAVAGGREPMKVRDSGMLEEQMWAAFFDAPDILGKLGCDDRQADIVEFGCGYGTFTVAAARRTTGTVFALDIEPAMIEATRQKAESAGQRNVQTRLRCCAKRLAFCGRAAKWL